MMIAAYAAVAAAPVFGLVAPRLVRRLTPPRATWLLTAGGLTTAFAAGTSTAIIAFHLLARSTRLSERWGWSSTVLARQNPVPVGASVCAALVLLVLLARSVRMLAVRVVALSTAHRLAASFSPAPLVVMDDARFRAVALPGSPGKIVLSSGLLHGTGPTVRRVVIAHEKAHLDHHHHLHHSAALIAAAANPFLRLLPDAVGLACERWADEDAALTACRRTMADALIKIGSCPADTGAPTVTLPVATTHVAQRVSALLAPTPVRQGRYVSALVALIVVPVALVLSAGIETERLFELAQHAFRDAR